MSTQDVAEAYDHPFPRPPRWIDTLTPQTLKYVTKMRAKVDRLQHRIDILEGQIARDAGEVAKAEVTTRNFQYEILRLKHENAELRSRGDAK
jgi:hypothetical protein